MKILLVDDHSTFREGKRIDAVQEAQRMGLLGLISQ